MREFLVVGLVSAVIDVEIDTGHKLNEIGMKHPFVCANFDWWPNEKCDYGNCSWVDNGINKINFDDQVLQQAAKALTFSGLGIGAEFGLLRIGGSLQDHINYDFESKEEHCDPFPMKLDPNDHLGFDQGCVTKSKRTQIRKFADDMGLKVIFGLNGLKGRVKNDPYWNYTGDWNSTEAEMLLEEWHDLYAVELGNEIAGQHGVTAHLEPEQYAKDFAKLLSIRDGLKSKKKPKVFGVDNALDLPWMDEFLGNLSKNSNSTIDAFTWHSYPLGAGALSKVDEEIMDPKFGEKIIQVGQNIKKWAKDKTMEVWMGETGGAYNSGRNTVTNRFMSAFWYLDWMGILSEQGHKAFCRQTLLGGNYGLMQNVNGTIKPNPDFWAAKLFTDLFRGKIVKAHSKNDLVHIYSCIAANNQPETVSVLLMNYSQDNQIVRMTDFGPILAKMNEVDIWMVTSTGQSNLGDLQSEDVYINNQKAEFPLDTVQIPNPLQYVQTSPAQPIGMKIELPGHSYTFLRFLKVE